MQSIFIVLGILQLPVASAIVRSVDCMTKDAVEGGFLCSLPHFDFLGSTTQLEVKLQGEENIVCEQSPLKNTRVWYGECNGYGFASLVASKRDNGNHVVLFGSVRSGDLSRQAATDSQGHSTLECLAADAVDEDSSMEEVDDEDNSEAIIAVFDHAGFAMARSNRDNYTESPGGRRRLYKDDGKHLDMLFVWTKMAECRNSQLPDDCTTLTTTTEANMRGQIEAGVQTTNVAFELSGIDLELSTVHAYRDDDYVETGSRPLWNLWSKTDGNMDDVHEKRSLYGADLVNVVVGRMFAGGVACSSPTNPGQLFSAVTFTSLAGTGLNHEIGHNVS